MNLNFYTLKTQNVIRLIIHNSKHIPALTPEHKEVKLQLG